MSDVISHTPPQTLLPERARNTRALLCVLVIMAFLAALSLLFARGASHLTDDWRAQLTNTATVQIMSSRVQNRAEQVSAAQDILQNLLPKADIAAMPEPESRALLRPWLGNTQLPEDLPVPSLITVKAQNTLPFAQMKAALSAEGLIVNIDDHTRYADGLRRTSRGLVFGSSLILALLLIASLAVNIFATRASLLAQKDIISVLAQVGATNKFIAKLFIQQAARRAAFGSVIGIGLAILTWVVLSITDLGALKESGLIWGKLGFGLIDILFLMALALFFVLICAMAAGMTALRELAQERRKV